MGRLRVEHSVNRLTVVAMTNPALEGMAGAFAGELMEAVYAD
jgi:hypothetical protein